MLDKFLEFAGKWIVRLFGIFFILTSFASLSNGSVRLLNMPGAQHPAGIETQPDRVQFMSVWYAVFGVMFLFLSRSKKDPGRNGTKKKRHKRREKKTG